MSDRQLSSLYLPYCDKIISATSMSLQAITALVVTYIDAIIKPKIAAKVKLYLWFLTVIVTKQSVITKDVCRPGLLSGFFV
jgi:hypothetical protein